MALDEKALQNAARDFARKTAAQSLKVFIELRGELGAGKSTFARAFIAQWLAENGESSPDLNAISPTYNIARIYGDKRPVAHLDLYRLMGLQELEQIGYERYFYEHDCVLIEWPEQIENFESLRPQNDALVFSVEIQIKNATTRDLKLTQIS